MSERSAVGPAVQGAREWTDVTPVPPAGKAHDAERRFLRGPQARGSELWEAGRIFLEFIRGFRALHFVGPCVTVFGSTRTTRWRARSAPGWRARGSR